MKYGMRMRKLFAILLTMAMIVSMVSMGAMAATDGYFTYIVQDGEAKITSVSSSASGVVTIPAYMGRFPVTSIGGFGSNRNITEVVIPEGVRTINGGAFYYCENLARITIPESVTTIGNLAFGYCMALESIEIPGNVERIEPNTFEYCSSMTSVQLPDSVTSIGESAFRYCYSLTDINFPANLTSIGQVAFNQCKLKNIHLPASLEEIEGNAFLAVKNIESITVEQGNASYRAAGNCLIDSRTNTLILGCDNSVLPADGGIASIGYYAFANNTGLTEITIPQGVKTIENSAFYQCKGLKTVTMADSVESIGNAAFSGCSALEDVKLNQGLKSLGDSAFSDCVRLTSIVLPDSTTTLGSSVFYRCSGLTSVHIPGSVSAIPSNAFFGCTALERVTMGDGIVSIGNGAFRESGLKSVALPQSVTQIGNYAFMNSKLKSISIGSNVTEISKGAFALCNSLTQVWYAGESQAEISIDTNENDNLMNATWYYGACGEHSFDSACDSVCDSCGFDRSASHIFDNACDEVCNLCQQANPDAHTYVGGTCSVCGAFQPITGTTGDCTWTLRGTVLTISGTGYTYIEDCLGLPWGTAITEVTVGEGVINLDGGMFYECTQLSKVSLPSTLTTIEWAAFYGCTSLKEIGLPKSVNSVRSIGREAFDGCTALTDVWYEGDSFYFAAELGALYEAFWHYNSCVYNPNGYNHSYVNSSCEYCGNEGKIVVSIEIQNVELLEFGYGYYDGDLYVYYLPMLKGVVTWQNGTTETFEGELNIDDEWYYIATNEWDLQYEEPWTVGNTYIVTGEVLGASTTFRVTIVEHPIQSFEIQDIALKPYKDGWYEDEGVFYYELPTLEGTVTWLDGTTEEISDGLYIDDEWYSINTNRWELQNQEPWTEGNIYTVTATLAGVSTTFQVTIVESPTAKSIEVKDVEIIEKHHGYYNADQFIYNLPTLNGTVTWADGTTEGFSGYVEIDDVWYSVDDNGEELQGEEPWVAGNTYTVTATLMGASTTFKVTIVPNPVESIVFKDLIWYEGIDTYYDGKYRVNLVLEKVVLKDGTLAEIVNNEIVFGGVSYYPDDNAWDMQYEEPWTVGNTYTVTGKLLGVSATFNVTIQENPIEKLELIQMPEKMEYLQGEAFSLKGAIIRIQYRDGDYEDVSIERNIEGQRVISEKLNRTSYMWVYEEFETPMVTIELFGEEVNISFVVRENPAESIYVWEDADKSVIITVNNSDGTSYDAKLVDWDIRAGDVDYRGGWLVTDKGQFQGGYYFSDDTISIVLYVGERTLVSNTLPMPEFIKIKASISFYTLHGIYGVNENLVQHYTGVITGETIDSVIEIAGELHHLWYSDEAIEDGDNYSVYHGETIREVVLKYFALDDLDLTLSKFYNPETDTYCHYETNDGYGGDISDYPTEITYSNGVWTLVDRCNGNIIKVQTDREGRILSIQNNAPQMVEPEVSLQYPSLSFENEILYNVYYTIDDVSNVVEMGLVTFNSKLTGGTIADAMDVIPGFVNSGSTYMAQTNGIPAKNLGDALYFKVYAKLSDGSYVYSDIAGYHAVAYANSVLNNAGSSAKAKALVVAMLNYGAAAQEYFGYKTDALMNAGLTAEQQALVRPYDSSMVQNVVKADAGKVGPFVMDGGYSNIWPTVSFEGAFAINFYFAPSQTVDGSMTMYYWDAETYNRVVVLAPWNASGTITMSEDGSNWGAAVEGIAAKSIDETVYVAALYTSGGVTYSTGVIAYSLGQYCKTIANNGEAFGAATAVYGFYAKSYFN